MRSTVKGQDHNQRFMVADPLWRVCASAPFSTVRASCVAFTDASARPLGEFSGTAEFSLV